MYAKFQNFKINAPESQRFLRRPIFPITIMKHTDEFEAYAVCQDNIDLFGDDVEYFRKSQFTEVKITIIYSSPDDPKNYTSKKVLNIEY